MDNLNFNSSKELLELEISKLKRQKSLSLRKIATICDISPGRLSELISGKRNITHQLSIDISNKLNFDHNTKSYFEALVLKEQENRKLKKTIKRKITNNQENTDEYILVKKSDLDLLNNWYSMTILELTKLDDFELSASWVARKLGISTLEAEKSIQKLKELKFLYPDNQTGEIKTNLNFRTTTDISSKKLRQMQHCFIDKAKKSLDEDDVSQRDITSLSIAISTNDLPEAKEYIKRFRRNFSSLMNKNHSKNKLYNLNIQLFPLSK